jgi:hypothetical protein
MNARIGIIISWWWTAPFKLELRMQKLVQVEALKKMELDSQRRKKKSSLIISGRRSVSVVFVVISKSQN